MTVRRTILPLYLLAVVGLLGLAVWVSTAKAITSTSYSGTTSDGGSWVADVPSAWNGTLLVFSHGFGPPAAADAPDPSTKQALLDRGYALVGSSYDPGGSWWALNSALRDQFEAVAGVNQDLPSAPRHVIALGQSMGGLISALEDEANPYGHVDGSLTTCGIVAGAIQLNNYQLDGEYTISKLLAPSEPIKLVRFASPADGSASGELLSAAAQQAQTSAQGRARLALAMAFLNVSPWAPGASMPARHDYGAQEQGQYDVEFTDHSLGPFNTMGFVEFGRPYIEQAAGGNGSWTAGVDFARLLYHSSYAPEVRALYREAGLSLHRDLAALTQGADIKADTSAIRSLERTSVPSGRLLGPELDLHTISDQLVPVQQEKHYARAVRRAGSKSLLKQAFIERQVHCNFTPAELVAGVLAVQHRVETGRWDSVAQPKALEATARSLALGDAAFVPYRPDPLSGDNGPFDPLINGTG
jgi:hypothetical protein